MRIWQTEIDLERLTNRGSNTLSEHLGIVFTEVGDDYLVAEMTLAQHHKQPLGIMHGGASCVLAETVGSAAANFCVDQDHYCVGLDINTNHLYAVKQGTLIATAKPFHLGRSTQVWGIEIKTMEGRLVSVNRLTMAVLAGNFDVRARGN
jgi:1,4-dihydroxy-2-naphthoyl-CoA hydrolase